MACTEQEVADQVRFILGYPDQELLPDAALTIIIQSYIPYYPLDTNCCELIYFSAIAAMNFIIRNLGASGSGLGGSKLREKEGNVEYEEDYREGGLIEYWKSELKRFKDDPAVLLPCLKDLPINITATSGYLLFGGVSQEEVDRVNEDLDSYNAYTEGFEDIKDQIGIPNRVLRG